jgi:hypothetical protein
MISDPSPILEPEEEDSSTTSLDAFTITSYGADYPVDSLVKRIQRGDIYIPEFQRTYVWKLEQASRFIESLLRGLPVPGIFLAKEPITNRLMVIDGQQRLKTLQYFYEGRGSFADKDLKNIPFRLRHVAALFEGKTYEDLSANDRRRLDDAIIPATIVRQEEPEEIDALPASLYYIFERLNTGGTQLESQEIRSAIYYGELNILLHQLNKYELWQRIFQGKRDAVKPDTDKRLKDCELILRFLALYFDLSSYGGSMKDFLTGFMRKNRHLECYLKADLENTFFSTIDVVYEALGDSAFRPRRGFHSAVFDAVMVGIARRLRQERRPDSIALAEAYNCLIKDNDFLRVSINAPQITSAKSVSDRLRLATEAFANL